MGQAEWWKSVFDAIVVLVVAFATAMFGLVGIVWHTVPSRDEVRDMDHAMKAEVLSIVEHDYELRAAPITQRIDLHQAAMEKRFNSLEHEIGTLSALLRNSRWSKGGS